MLRSLRLKLTVYYFIGGVILVALMGGGSYLVLLQYFQETTDLSIQHKMVTQFNLFGVSLPPELIVAEQTWFENQARLSANPRLDPEEYNRVFEELLEHEREEEYEEELAEELYEAELVPIFVLPLNAEGELIFDPNPYQSPLPPDLEAASDALEDGYDWRTTRLEDGTRVRLLTYRTSDPGAPALLQVGRYLKDQDRLLNQAFSGLLILGGLGAVLLSAGSWWLAGRSLIPAQKAWDQQQAFVANASHELRSPLTLMHASVEVALRGKLDNKQQELLQDVLQECDYMDRLVEDLLLLSRLDADRLELKKEEVHLADLLGEANRQIERLAEKHGVHVVLDGSEGKVLGDRTRLRQVLLILLDNALSHTPSGGTISLASKASGKSVQITVADNGVGIPAEHLPHVFERFYQANNGRSDEFRSHGLGLSIAKGLIEAQGGTIHLGSWEGKGTQVTITLPGGDP